MKKSLTNEKLYIKVLLIISMSLSSLSLSYGLKLIPILIALIAFCVTVGIIFFAKFYNTATPLIISYGITALFIFRSHIIMKNQNSPIDYFNSHFLFNPCCWVYLILIALGFIYLIIGAYIYNKHFNSNRKS